MTTLAAPYDAMRRTDWNLPVGAFAVYAIVCTLALHPTALSMAQTWLSSSSYHHAIAVAPLAVWMIMTRPRVNPATAPAFLALIIAAGGAWLCGVAAGVALIEQLAFVTLLIAGAGLTFGAVAFRLWAGPLLFLYFMVPLGESLTPALQKLTAHSVVFALNAVSISASIDGVVIRTTAGAFEIAEACAGLNFLLAALMIAVVYASQVFSRMKTMLAFIAVATLVALAANFLRAFLLILAATLSDMRFAVTADHLVVGLVFYALVFLLLFRIGETMRERVPAPLHAPAAARRPWCPSIALAALAPVIAASLYASTIVNAAPSLPPVLHPAPLSVAGWRILDAPQNWTPILAADKIDRLTYDQAGARVYAAFGYFTHDRTGAEIVTAANRPDDGAAWRRSATLTEPMDIFGASGPMRLTGLTGHGGRRLLAATLYWRGDRTYTNGMAFKLDQMRDKLSGKNPPGGIMIFAADYTGHPDEAVMRLRRFFDDAESFDTWRARIEDPR